ncbi:hypothetical protein TEA_022145 [Camellia sinensis var. sinensis]|uniref:RPW8 domain-containing protein n=1 Tax=Camellia sinensis var. sinensis TaxID=542762 RepID=A0A4S4DS06_CAMSN|nr:hypothetical protein TEA_022145 [Camellia sinensis var. sinensis]
MAGSLVGGAALGAAFGELLRAVDNGIINAVQFKSTLTSLRSRLNQISPMLEEIDKLNRKLGRSEQDTEMFTNRLKKGLHFIEAQAQMSMDSRRILVVMNQVDEELGRMNTGNTYPVFLGGWDICDPRLRWQPCCKLQQSTIAERRIGFCFCGCRRRLPGKEAINAIESDAHSMMSDPEPPYRGVKRPLEFDDDIDLLPNFCAHTEKVLLTVPWANGLTHVG